MGGKFYVYQAKSNNCQFFVMSILRANDLDTKQNEEFVIQDATSLFSDSFRKTSNTVTDIGAAVNTLTDNDVIKKSVDTTKAMVKKAKNTAETIAEKAKQVLLGSGIFDDIGRAVTKTVKKIVPKNIGKKVGIDVLNESKRLGSKAGEGYAFVNPFDLGFQAGYKGAEAVDKGLSGKGVGRKKMVKGSPEAIAWGKKMREARMKKKGGD